MKEPKKTVSTCTTNINTFRRSKLMLLHMTENELLLKLDHNQCVTQGTPAVLCCAVLCCAGACCFCTTEDYNRTEQRVTPASALHTQNTHVLVLAHSGPNTDLITGLANPCIARLVYASNSRTGGHLTQPFRTFDPATCCTTQNRKGTQQLTWKIKYLRITPKSI